jgi:acyl-homoserine-lactone acylase
MRMLLADRVKPDLLQAVQASRPGAVAARGLLEAWDNTAAARQPRRRAVRDLVEPLPLLMAAQPAARVEWSADEPTTTPARPGRPARAAEAFAWAVPETARLFGAWDVAWGDVHRVRRGDVDVPVGGCAARSAASACSTSRTADDGRRVVNGGDGWVIAVEFGDEPRAYSVLGYGQSPGPASPLARGPGALCSPPAA